MSDGETILDDFEPEDKDRTIQACYLGETTVYDSAVTLDPDATVDDSKHVDTSLS